MCWAAPTSGGFANIDLNPRRPKYSVRFCRSSFLSYHKNVPGRGSPRDRGVRRDPLGKARDYTLRRTAGFFQSATSHGPRGFSDR